MNRDWFDSYVTSYLNSGLRGFSLNEDVEEQCMISHQYIKEFVELTCKT